MSKAKSKRRPGRPKSDITSRMMGVTITIPLGKLEQMDRLAYTDGSGNRSVFLRRALDFWLAAGAGPGERAEEARVRMCEALGVAITPSDVLFRGRALDGAQADLAREILEGVLAWLDDAPGIA